MHLMVPIERAASIKVVVLIKFLQDCRKSHVIEVWFGQGSFEDKVKPLVKLIGHRFIGGGGPNIIGRIDLKVEDDHITFENDERKGIHEA